MNKIKFIIQEEIQSFFENQKRALGKSVNDIKGSGKSKIYRAVSEDVDQFHDRDYVTMSLKFAVEHAENNEVYSDFSEKFKVISYTVDNSNLFQAVNPGEYLYSGPSVDGKTIYISKGYDYEGFIELTRSDYINEEYKDEISRHKIENVLKNTKIGDYITIIRDNKKQVVFFAGQKGDAFFATTYRPGEKQHRQDSYMRLYPAKNINLIKIGKKDVESKEDFAGRIEYYQEKEREEKRDMYKQAYAREKADPNIHENLPFDEKSEGENIYRRTFKENVNSQDLVWHRDAEDRTIETIGETDWKFQLDNNLPQNMHESIFVPKGTYHRIIKGSGSLDLKITKFK